MDFALPGEAIQAELSGPGGSRTERLTLDTVLVDLDTRQVLLTWRLVLPRPWGMTAARLDSITLGSSS